MTRNDEVWRVGLVPEQRRAQEFEEWVQPNLVALRRFAVSLSSVGEAEDIVQDALERAWAKWGQFDPERGTSRSWLLAIVADRARRGWSRRRPDVTVSTGRLTKSAEPTYERVDIGAAVNSLPSRQRLAIVLYHYLDLPVAEVADVMRCSLGTVKSTLSDARANLQTRLGTSYERD